MDSLDKAINELEKQLFELELLHDIGAEYGEIYLEKFRKNQRFVVRLFELKQKFPYLNVRELVFLVYLGVPKINFWRKYLIFKFFIRDFV